MENDVFSKEQAKANEYKRCLYLPRQCTVQCVAVAQQTIDQSGGRSPVQDAVEKQQAVSEPARAEPSSQLATVEGSRLTGVDSQQDARKPSGTPQYGVLTFVKCTCSGGICNLEQCRVLSKFDVQSAFLCVDIAKENQPWYGFSLNN